MIVIKNKSVRNVLKLALPFALIPIVIALGVTVFDEKKYLFISFAVAVLSIALFISGYEKKLIGSRRAVTVSVMTALCIVGRFIPLFKPITALTVISAMYLGGEAGFLVGAMSALISNFYFGQGPWTPFQMLAWGLIGLVAGYISKPLKKSRLLLCVYGVVCGIAFSLVMDVWSVVWYSGRLDPTLYLTSVLAALPHTAIYAISNFIFLWFLARPFGEKLERIKIKYGI